MTIQATSCVSFHNLTIKKSVHFNLSFICWLKVLIIFAFSFIFYYLFINFFGWAICLILASSVHAHVCVCISHSVESGTLFPDQRSNPGPLQ